MEAAETQLARALAVLTEREFPCTRGLETRLDAYLQLEDLQRLEDSEASVTQLRKHLPLLLSEVRFDLQQNLQRDVLLAALRCLSYFMHHRGLISVFSDEYLAWVLEELLARLFTTEDRYMYKLCLFSLTMQNIAPERHKFLPRTVEALVQAVVNPFKSRAIEVQALKGLRLLLVKYPDQLGTDGTILNIYVRPIASRLSSRETSTRTQARMVLEEASKHVAKWSEEALEMVQDCMEEYALPVMKSHVDGGRLKDAVYLWKLILTLLRSKFSSDMAKLNKVLYVPERCMEDGNAAVRMMAMQAWTLVVDVVRNCQNWLFNKAVVGLLAWPVKLCIKQERLLNILDTAFSSWRTIASIAVQDFNVYCTATGQSMGPGEHYRHVPEWKSWYGELVISPLLTLMMKRSRSKHSASTAIELKPFIEFVKDMWEPKALGSCNRESKVLGSGETRGGVLSYESDRSTVIEGAAVEATVGAKHLEASLVAKQSDGRVCISSELRGVALLLHDIFGVIPSLIAITNESHDEHVARYAHDLAITTWKGVCRRIFSDGPRKGANIASNLALRLARRSIEFSFGIYTGSAMAAKSPSSAAPVKHTGDSIDGHNGGVGVVSSAAFGLKWQLQLLATLLSNVAVPEDLRAVVLHPKCTLFDCITQRMHCHEQRFIQCATVLEKWSGSKSSEPRIDFSAKSNALPYLVINLLFEYAILADSTDSNHEVERESTWKSLDMVLRRLMECMKLNASMEVRGLDALAHFVEASILVAYKRFGHGSGVEVNTSMLDEFVNVSKNLREEASENSHQSASLALGLHGPRDTFSVVKTASTAGIPSDGSDAEEKCANNASHEAECLLRSRDTDTCSLCLLSGEVSKMPSASLRNRTAASSVDELMQAQRKSRRSSCHGPIESVSSESADIQLSHDGASGARCPPMRPVRDRCTSSELSSKRIGCLDLLDRSQCVYPGLIGCVEGIALLYRYLPEAFRPLFSCYKVETIGDLSALSLEKVESFGFHQSVSTIRRALEDFDACQERTTPMPSNSFQKQNDLTAESLAILLPSLHKRTKRGFSEESEGIAGRHEHKRIKSSLLLEAKDRGVQQDGEGCGQKAGPATKIAACYPTGGTGETRIACRVDCSSDRSDATDDVGKRVNAQDKVSTCTLKLLQHLRRSGYYVDTLIAEEESTRSEEASLRTNIAALGGVLANYHEAHDLVSRLASRLRTAAETSSERCRKLLDKCGST